MESIIANENRTGDLAGPPAEIGQVIPVSRCRIRPFKGQPRQYFDPADLSELAESMKAENGGKQVVDITADMPMDPLDIEHPFEICDGERRWRASELISPDFILSVKIVERLPYILKFRQSLRANHGRKGHTEQEETLAIKILSDAGSGDREIAATFSKSIAWVQSRKRLLSLTQSVFSMLDPRLPEDKRLNATAAGEVAAVHPGLQLACAEKILRERLRLPQVKLMVLRIQEESRTKKLIAPAKASPNHNRRKIDGAIERILIEMTTVLELMKDKDLDSALSARSPDENGHLVRTLEKAAGDMAEFYEIIRDKADAEMKKIRERNAF